MRMSGSFVGVGKYQLFLNKFPIDEVINIILDSPAHVPIHFSIPGTCRWYGDIKVYVVE